MRKNQGLFQTLFLLIILPIMALGVLCLNGSAALAERSYGNVASKGELRCGYALSPPYLVKDPQSGALSGYDYDIWTEIGKELDLKIIWSEQVGLGNVVEGLKSNKFDVFCSQIWLDSGRIRALTLTDPILFTKVKLYARKDDVRFDGDLKKINDSTVTMAAIENDVTNFMVTRGFPSAKVDLLPPFATRSDMAASLLGQKSDVLILDQASAEAIDALDPGKMREIANIPPLYNLPAYYAVARGQYQLRDMINIALHNIINDGRLANIVRSHSASFILPRKDF